MKEKLVMQTDTSFPLHSAPLRSVPFHQLISRLSLAREINVTMRTIVPLIIASTDSYEYKHSKELYGLEYTVQIPGPTAAFLHISAV